MGRGKIEIRRIENAQNRHVTFTKRKNGIIKKATELSILCQVDIALIVFSSSGKWSDFCSAPLTKILERFQKSSEVKLWDAKHESLNAEIECVRKENEKMQMELRHLKGEDLQSLEIKHLRRIEDILEEGSAKAREKVAEIHKTFERNIKILKEENKELNTVLQKQQQKLQQLAVSFRDMHLECLRKESEFAAQVPFPFRLPSATNPGKLTLD